MAPSNSTYERGGTKLYARAMALINMFEAKLHTAIYLLALLYIIVSQIRVLTADCDVWVDLAQTTWYLPGCVYVVPTMRHLDCHHRIHTGERNMYTMLGYSECLPLSRHMRLHTAYSVAGCMPFECTICDYRIILMPVTNRLFRIVKNLKRWTLWDYSHLLINVHYAGKKY